MKAVKRRDAPTTICSMVQHGQERILCCGFKGGIHSESEGACSREGSFAV